MFSFFFAATPAPPPAASTRALPPTEALHRLLRYDPDTGLLHWRHRTPDSFRRINNLDSWNATYAGQPAGALFTAGRTKYRTVRVSGTPYLAHRLIWKMVFGEDPLHIDHVDGDGTNNRIENLRSVTSSGNQRNQRTSAASTTGVTGVHLDPRNGRFRARVRVGPRVDGRKVFLGSYATLEEASAAVEAAKVKYGYHLNHGRKPLDAL